MLGHLGNDASVRDTLKPWNKVKPDRSISGT